MVWGVALQRILKYLGFILFRNRNTKKKKIGSMDVL